MLISLELLKNFIDIEPLNLTPEELAERLTFSGSEVESVTYSAGKMKSVVAAKIDALETHPKTPSTQSLTLTPATAGVSASPALTT